MHLGRILKSSDFRLKGQIYCINTRKIVYMRIDEVSTYSILEQATKYFLIVAGQ